MKKFSKYALNTLTIINALILGINSVEGITIPYVTQITGVISVVMAVISTYLLGNKGITSLNKPEINTRMSEEEFEELCEKEGE